MCDYPCSSPPPKQKFRKLTELMLDCWQREYDRRPYKHFRLERLKFEEKLDRSFHPRIDFKVVTSFLSKHFLWSMKLVGLRFGKDDVSTISDFVKYSGHIENIAFQYMDLPTEFFRQLHQAVDFIRVRVLSLEGTPLNDEDICELHPFIVKSRTLKNFNVSSCKLNQYNFAQIADAIYKSSSLRACNLSHLSGLHLTIDSEKIIHIVASLIWQNKLQEIILENCGFIGHDMEIIAEYMYSNYSKLQTLSVSCNKIGANGALALLKAISNSGTLKHLSMSSCGLGTHGGEFIAQYLSSCWGLESLAIKYNNIGAEAINMILLCIKKCCKLRKISLFGNFFNSRTGETLKRLLDAGILLQEHVDITLTFDDTIGGYRIIPWLT